jgi:hypothetical protein
LPCWPPFAGGNQRQPLINRRESAGFFTLQTQDAKQMIVCEQGNGELAARVRYWSSLLKSL